jgi:hypothetical protein
MPSSFNPSPNNISGVTEISGNLFISGTVSASAYIGAGGSGETNTASNVGSGTGLFKQKSGADLQFKTLEGSGVTINSYASVIGLTASGGGSTNPGGSDGQVQFNQNGSFAGDSGLSYDGSGSLSFGSATSDVHQVTGTLTVNGNVSASNIVPHDDLTYDLGSTSLQWNNIYANELIGDVEGAVRFDAINSEGATISKGQVVYINGVSGQTPTIGLAACDDASKMPAFGLAATDAANSASVQIVTFGSLGSLNLSTLFPDESFTEGDAVFVQTGSGGTAGTLTTTPPTGSNNLLQNVGQVVRNSGGGDNQIKVGGAGRSNATPNLDEGYLFVGNESDQSVQDNTVYISSSVNRVGINNTTPDHTLTVGGNVKYGTAASDQNQVTGTLSISGSQPLKVFGPQAGVGGASIIARHTSSIDDWETPISGALVVSADVWTAGEQNTGAVMYVHSQDEAAIIGFKNSSTLVSGEQKNAVTTTAAKGASIGLVSDDIFLRNHIGDVILRVDGAATNEIVVSGEGTRIGNATSDRHQFTGSIKISGSTGEAVGLLHVRGDVTSSNNVSASAFHGDGSNLTGISVGETNTASNVGGATGLFKQKTGVDLEFKTLEGSGVTINSYANVIGLTASSGGSVAGSDSHVQFNQNGSFAGNDKLTYNGTGSLFVSSSISASIFQADFKNLTATPQTMKFQVITASLSSQEDSGGHFEFELADGDTNSDTSFSIKQIGGTTFFKVEGDGRTDIDGDVFLATGHKIQSPTVEVTSLLHGEDGGGDATFGLDIAATSQQDYDSANNHINIDFLGTNRFLRFRDNSADDGSQNIIAQIASSSLGGISFDYYTGSISNVSSLNATHITASYVSASTSIQSDLFKNGYYSASINSNTSVPTSQYNFFNYTVGATLSLTASNPVAGASYVFILRQDSTGGRVITFDSSTFKFPSGSAPSMSTGSHEVDILSGISDGVFIYADAAKKFS